MNLPRRSFLGSSLFVFGGTLMDALTTPLWGWRRSLILQPTAPANQTSPVQFVDVAREAGLNVPNVWGGADHKGYIIEAKGSGLISTKLPSYVLSHNYYLPLILPAQLLPSL